jgi:NAD(P)-dependent dehydrogenase (short-subunit alcohol dehydrogenase family)
MKLTGKVIAVTGAGSGIGRALALTLAAKGARVAGFDLRKETMDETASLVRAAGGVCTSFAGDVSQPDAATAFLASVLAEHHTVDGLVNNAGIIQPFVPFSKLTLEQAHRVFGVNWWGVVQMTHAFLPELKKRSEASLVNVSSMGGLCPVPGQGVYGASKAAVKLFSESLALELDGGPVRVTTVFPGGVKTNITLNAPDIAEAEKKKQLEQAASSNYGVTAEEAAKKIVRAIETGRERITIGPDAAALDKLSRLAPHRSGHLMASLMARAGVKVSDE